MDQGLLEEFSARPVRTPLGRQGPPLDRHSVITGIP